MEKQEKTTAMLLTPFDIEEKLSKFGFGIDENGFVIDIKTKQLVKANDGGVINIYKDKDFAFISGHSRIFVRDIADYVEYLSDKSKLKF
ncbi:MAG: hypothetical protein BJBARM4_0811 [Candidatus Parvarchaeum acidiphilum ARMAN-4]|jgi:hypothetical protein|uniref:Uncharacterized protein n=2 Tax=Parvarchaeum acidiphilum TaxID=662759 RepID=D2EGB1_PARA4|nr:hypothetical protein [Candidatus Parvarchaeum acidiphilum ARMAN-4]EEZ92614.1 MAG: hypothetical protein BJBARM4_0811 [Candidatus Parvarchaeum acidiphilum ARMAN-4]EGD71805.1 MAG: hypothetical protein CSMARM4_0045 [Candidatus Parvarchaeum acidiphilum ARMAN-4_'5-way FS']